MDSAKIKRKSARYAARLLQRKAVSCAETPQQNIVICNGGQAIGLTINHIIEQMKVHHLDTSTLDKFICVKGETHSFLKFKSIEAAVVFFEALNGKPFICDDEDKKSMGMILLYVEKMPDNEEVCIYENPKGLHLLEDFITKEEEQEFVAYFDWQDDTNQSLKNRQVMHYGLEFRYGTNDVDISQPLDQEIPDMCRMLWDRLKEHGFDLRDPDQLTVNKYCPGQGIPSHVDKHSPFGDTILSLSLGSDVVMDWKHHSGKYVPVVVRARSMLVMQGEARYDWKHAISPRNYDPVISTRTIKNPTASTQTVRVVTSDCIPRSTRLSLTFRWTRHGPCRCPYPVLCDSVERTEMADDIAARLEELHVHQVYETIATHFGSTRHTAWPRVREFMEGLPSGAVVLDLGCGNGKNLARRNDVFQIGGERSSALLRECQTNVSPLLAVDWLRLDVLQPCLIDSCADAVICIAVLHHLSSHARRQRVINRLLSLLAPGGRALITVWSKDQSDSKYLAKNPKQSGDEVRSIADTSVTLPVHENRTQFKCSDMLVPWKLKQKKQSVGKCKHQTVGKRKNQSEMVKRNHQSEDKLKQNNQLDDTLNRNSQSKDTVKLNLQSEAVNCYHQSEDALKRNHKLEGRVTSNHQSEDIMKLKIRSENKLKQNNESENELKRNHQSEDRLKINNQSEDVTNNQSEDAPKNQSEDAQNNQSAEADTFLRYYHVFEKGELDGLCLMHPGVTIESSFKEEGNWVVICRRNR